MALGLQKGVKLPVSLLLLSLLLFFFYFLFFFFFFSFFFFFPSTPNSYQLYLPKTTPPYQTNQETQLPNHHTFSQNTKFLTLTLSPRPFFVSGRQ